MPQEQHQRREREQGENAVTEEGESGMEFDPRILAEDADAAGGVPGRHREGDERERGGGAGGEEAEHAGPERDADDQVERDGRPGGELEQFKGVAERVGIQLFNVNNDFFKPQTLASYATSS